MAGTLAPSSGDVLLNSTGTGTIGRSVIFAHPGQFIIDGHITLLRPRQGRADGTWLNSVLRTTWGQNFLETQCYSGSTNQVELSRTRLAAAELPAPSFPEQRRIAEILDTVEEALRKTDRLIAKLKQVKRGLLHDLLSRGIDENGELRNPALHPGSFRYSSMGAFPSDWEIVETASLCSVITKGTTPASAAMWRGGNGIPFLRVDNLSFDGTVDLLASQFRISRRTHTRSLSRSRTFPGDVLTNIVGPPLGKVGLITADIGEANINQAIAVFRPTTALRSRFLLLWLVGQYSQQWLRRSAKQTSGQMNLTLKMCQQLPIPRLSVEEQDRIVSRMDAAEARLTSELALARKIGILRQGLMEDLLTGRVRTSIPSRIATQEMRSTFNAESEGPYPAAQRR